MSNLNFYLIIKLIEKLIILVIAYKIILTFKNF